jgi:hypothetical protein
MATQTAQQEIDRLNANIVKRTANIGAVRELRRRIWQVNGTTSRLLEHLNAIQSDDGELKAALMLVMSLLPARDEKAEKWLSGEENKNAIATEKLMGILAEIDK